MITSLITNTILHLYINKWLEFPRDRVITWLTSAVGKCRGMSDLLVVKSTIMILTILYLFKIFNNKNS